MLVGVIISTIRKSARTLFTDFDYGRFRMALLVVIIVYNFTEATFKGVAFLNSMFLLVAVEYLGQREPVHEKLTSLADETGCDESV